MTYDDTLQFRRSEAFAEDVADFVPPPSSDLVSRKVARWLVNWLPLAVALVGVAFAIIPPLG
jgi:hypothetical protein